MFKRKIALLFILALVCCSCSHLTPAQRVLWGLNVYQAQYDEYLSLVINPNLDAETKAYLREHPDEIEGNYLNPDLSEETKKMLRVKKEILIQLKPLVIMATEYQQTGKLPPDEVQTKLTGLINRLVELAEEN